MEKNLVNSLKAWAEEEGIDGMKRCRSGHHQVMLRALQSDIEEAIEVGYSRKFIWEYLSKKEKISCKYSTFLNFFKSKKTPKQEKREETLLTPALAKQESEPAEKLQANRPATNPPAPSPQATENEQAAKDWRGEKFDKSRNSGKMPPQGYSAASTYMGINELGKEIWHDPCPDPARLLKKRVEEK